MEYKFKKHYKGRGVFIMERTISIEERIRRAEEIYYRRQNRDIRVSSSTVNSGQKTTLPLFKKMILQLLICTVIYFIFYLIKNNNYIFSQDVMERTSEILKYDVNFNNLYNNAIVFINKQKQPNIEENEKIQNEEKEKLQSNENKEPTEEKNEEEEKKENNGVGGGGNAEIVAVVSEPSAPKTQMELDADYVKENYNLILPIQGIVTSRFGKREPTDIISENHQGIDLGAEAGTSIKSAMDGEVIISGTDRDYR